MAQQSFMEKFGAPLALISLSFSSCGVQRLESPRAKVDTDAEFHARVAEIRKGLDESGERYRAESEKILAKVHETRELTEEVAAQVEGLKRAVAEAK